MLYIILVQALRNLVNVSGQRIQKIFNALDRRLKSSDKKDQSGVIGQGDEVEKTHKKITEHRGPSDTATVSITGTGSI